MNGKRPESYFPNVAEMYKSLKEDERILFDIESGFPYKVTKEYYDTYMNMIKGFMYSAPNNKGGGIIGQIFITGTGEGFSKCSTDAKEMFYNPEKYNIKPYGEFDRDSETY